MKVVLIGAGNIASHLGPALFKAGHVIKQVGGRTKSTVTSLAKKLHAEPVYDLSLLTTKADLYIIAVPDGEIAAVIAQLPFIDRCVAHTSGAVSLSVFPSTFENIGVFWPLQTITKNTSVNFEKVPICIEARSKLALNRLKKVGSSISKQVISVNSDERRWMHLAAVLVNNFPNHLFALAERLLTTKGISFDVLRPLIQETAKKVQHASPASVQTGPARRGDSTTVEEHLRLLANEPQLQEIYRLLSESIESLQGPRY